MALLTNLDLCKRLISDAGISGTFTTVVDQTGEFLRVVNWIDQAIQEIEGKWHNWNFLHNFQTFNTVASQSDYTITEMGAADLNLMDIRTLAVDADEISIPYQDWVTLKVDPTALSETGDQWLFTILPDKSIRLYNTPDAIRTLSFEYWQTATIMTVDASTPAIPAQFRYVIIAQALKYYAEFESADEMDYAGTRRYEPMIDQLESSELTGHQNSTSINTGTQIQVSVPYGGSGTGYQGYVGYDGYDW